MTAALEEVQKGRYFVRSISRMCGVPKMTLNDRVIEHGINPGPCPYLNKDEEKKLADHLVTVAKLGYGKTRRQVKLVAENVARGKGILRKQQISDGWWARFEERQPELSLWKADSTAHVRMDSVNKESMDHYYNLLGKSFE